MMSSADVSAANPSAVNWDRSSSSSSNRRKKKKKIQNMRDRENEQNSSMVEWKSDTQQQMYSSKLVQALRQVGFTGSKRVHEAADRVLAATAKGRTRWSRAILTNRLKLKFIKKHNIVKRHSKVISSRSQRKSKLKILPFKSKSLPAVQRKARVLSRLVPGCRKEPLPVVLEEATDYIAALQMQVKAMSALAALLSVSDPSSSSTSPNHLDSTST